MALEKLIECACRHDIGYHDEYGCHGRGSWGEEAPCNCRMRPNDVVDLIISVEVESTRRRWLSNNPFAQLEERP
jgi:hypothetical protein